MVIVTHVPKESKEELGLASGRLWKLVPELPEGFGGNE